MNSFQYDEAFSRNLGWLSREDLKILRQKRIAIAGLGGVGGIYALTLARLGIGKLTLADPDTFELANFNRQIGATLDTIGKNKCVVISELVHKINPEVEITLFKEGVNSANRADFLEDVDLYLDGLDFWALDERRLVFSDCRKKGIFATTVAPLGFSAALLNFDPKGMSFEKYFRLEGLSPLHQAARFLTGLSPSFLHRKALIDRSFVDFKNRKTPSTPIGVTLASAIASTEAVKILLKRGKIISAPTSVQVDAWTLKLNKCYRPFGNLNPLQLILFYIIKKQLNL